MSKTAESENAQSGSDGVTSSLVAQLKESIAQQDKHGRFACGGSFSFKPSSNEDAAPVSPISLRWDPTDTSKAASDVKLVFPLDDNQAPRLDQLIGDCQPATFGRGSEDVLDETYRKAGKMDPSAFSSTFNPYELGIVDTIAQALLPSSAESPVQRSVRAELYKLNIYSGPSGQFKAHVDTPRSTSQFGTLVVCLPVPHEGGELAVRYKDKEVLFGWGEKSGGEDPLIQWAAFYSDCEHEVLQVTSGHRVTLTYNLYAVRGNGFLTGHCPTLSTAKLPLYASVKTVLQDPKFMEKGGYLGFFCTHSYPYTDGKHRHMPDMLKGIDMVLWETFNALGLPTYIRAALDCTGLAFDYEGNDLYPDYYLGDDLNYKVEGCVDESCLEDEVFTLAVSRGATEAVKEANVQWVTRPGDQELQLTYAAYGNEPQTACIYSHCAMVVKVSPAAERVVDGERVEAQE